MLAAAAEVVLAVLLAPVLLGLVPAVAAGRRSVTDLYRLAFACSFALMPVACGALAWFAVWRLVAPSGLASQSAAILIGVLFGVQSLVMFYVLSIGAAMSGALGEEPPAHPRWFAYRSFCSWSCAVLLLSLPLALIVAVIMLLA